MLFKVLFQYDGLDVELSCLDREHTSSARHRTRFFEERDESEACQCPTVRLFIYVYIHVCTCACMCVKRTRASRQTAEEAEDEEDFITTCRICCKLLTHASRQKAEYVYVSILHKHTTRALGARASHMQMLQRVVKASDFVLGTGNYHKSHGRSCTYV